MTKLATKHPPHPTIARIRWQTWVIWLVPVAALVIAGFYAYDFMQEHGPVVTITFHDGSGLKPGETFASHLGVQIGSVESIGFTEDKSQVLVRVRLLRSADAFARTGARFWIVRPEISVESISGLGTIASGPYVEAAPGTGDEQADFVGLDQEPKATGPGLNLTLRAVRLERLQRDSPIYYRGIQVGVIKDIQLGTDAAVVNVRIFIRQRYVNLVRTNSVFWIISGFDVKGGILTGIQMKLDSVRTLISGGIAFATPEQNTGNVVREATEFPLFEDAKPEWENWAPHITLPPEDADETNQQIQSSKQTTDGLPKK